MPQEIRNAALIEQAAPEIAKALRNLNEQVAAINGKLDHLTELADQAAEFLHDPIGRYKRRRLGTLPKAGGDGAV